MGFQNGHQKKGGRDKGKPNRITQELRAILEDFFINELSTVQSRFEVIKSPEKRLELTIKLLPFVLPKMQELNLENLPEDKLSAILEILTDESE
jgi:hypothetical protein